MSNSLAHRDPATLVYADFDDRRRLATAELVMFAQEGCYNQLSQGQAILKHVVCTEEVAAMGDAIAASIRRPRR